MAGMVASASVVCRAIGQIFWRYLAVGIWVAFAGTAAWILAKKDTARPLALTAAPEFADPVCPVRKGSPFAERCSLRNKAGTTGIQYVGGYPRLVCWHTVVPVRPDTVPGMFSCPLIGLIWSVSQSQLSAAGFR